MTHGEPEAFAHVSPTGERCARVVAEIGITEVAEGDLAHVDHPDDRAVQPAAHEKASLGRAAGAARSAGGATQGRRKARLALASARNSSRSRADGARMTTRRPTATTPRLRTTAYFLRRTTTMMIGCRARSRSWWGLKPKYHW